MMTTVFVGSLILGLFWLFEHIGPSLRWAAVRLASLVLLFIIIVFVLPLLHDFLLNL